MSTAFLVDNILNDKEERTESLSSDTESDTTSDIKDSVCGSPRNDHLPNGDDKINISESLLRTYAMIRNSGHHIGIDEMCCAKCGHFQITKRGGYEDTDIDLDFKCDKCGGSEAINTKETILKDSVKPILKFSVSAILGDKKDCVKVRNEFIQPQHIWPYIQHNFIQQSQIQSHGYHINNNSHHNNISPTNNNPSEIDNLSNGSQPGSELQDDNRLHPRDKQLIAKPLASRPTPFIHHGINHPHLHSLLAHCRNPYMAAGGPQVFPLPPGQGFPWAHSTRGKPRRGMMRRAVFSDSQRKGLEKRFQMQKYISKPDRKKLAERLGLKDSQSNRKTII
ncbi:uncharacterized protein LOC119082492 [Bradysia coprophila]|uniref:uncharacterized protein LOC119082492 n=1 Tax=Bradysia coprophila TaxID=38358 RepID=UPI00187D8495|nr:uncharacterized protein LOC119082492 [Bradysia coprophila]